MLAFEPNREKGVDVMRLDVDEAYDGSVTTGSASCIDSTHTAGADTALAGAEVAVPST